MANARPARPRPHPQPRSAMVLPACTDAPGVPKRIDRLQKALFDGTSRLTRSFPRAGSRLLDLSFRWIVGSYALSALFTRHNLRVVRALGSFRRFLVIPDIHIGDAVMTQAAITALRDFFPEARIDYVVNKTAFPLIQGNPEATQVIPFFSNGTFPTLADLEALRALIDAGDYDLVLNFCPYIKDKDIARAGTGLLNFLSHAPTFVRNEHLPLPINHIIHQSYTFTRNFLSLAARPVRDELFHGVSLYLNDTAVSAARHFISEAGVTHEVPLVLFNPDAASIFTLMPYKQEAELLRRLAHLKAVILLGEGISEPGLGQRLRASLPARLQAKVKIVPAELSLEAYAALIDLCDVFISADTGPLHIAAARRRSCRGHFQFRNRTAVVGIFGATPARMSGYDSYKPGYLPANQDAPSLAYAAGSPCRNITCLNKMYKTCRNLRCFEDVNIEGLVRLVRTFLMSGFHRPGPLHELKAA